MGPDAGMERPMDAGDKHDDEVGLVDVELWEMDAQVRPRKLSLVKVVVEDALLAHVASELIRDLLDEVAVLPPVSGGCT